MGDDHRGVPAFAFKTPQVNVPGFQSSKEGAPWARVAAASMRSHAGSEWR
jgi:hypothetical protein